MFFFLNSNFIRLEFPPLACCRFPSSATDACDTLPMFVISFFKLLVLFFLFHSSFNLKLVTICIQYYIFVCFKKSSFLRFGD